MFLVLHSDCGHARNTCLTRKQRAQEYTFPDQKAPEYRHNGARKKLPRLWDHDAAGSNPVTRTMKEAAFVYQDKGGFFVERHSQSWYNHYDKSEYREELMKKATREHLAELAREFALLPFHGAVDGMATNLLPIVRLFPT